jgi:hypothetical protein
MSPEWPDKNSIKKEDRRIKKATQYYYMKAYKADVHQDDQSDGDNGSTSSKAALSQIGWSGLLIEQKESLCSDDRDAKDRLKKCITPLDNGSTLSLLSNPELVQGIQRSSKTVSLATDAGVKQSNRKVNVPGFGKVYYYEDAIANIFRFSDLKEKDQITYDSNKEDAFLVHIDNEILKFGCSPGLYQYSVSKGYQQYLKEDRNKDGTSNLISTVAKDRHGYT